MNGTMPSTLLESVKPRTKKVISQAEALAKQKNHKGFNALIYQQNTFLDFIDRLQGFMEHHEGVIEHLDEYEYALQDCAQKIGILHEKGTSINASEMEEATMLIQEIK